MWGMKTREARRAGVALNYGSVIGLGAAVCFGEYGVWNPLLAVLAIACAVLAVATFVLTYARTGFWSLVHTKADDLDERMLQVTHAGFRRSYLALGMVCLLLLVVVFVSVRFSVFTLTWRGHYSFGLVALMFVNYLVNILPASFLAWEQGSTPAQDEAEAAAL